MVTLVGTTQLINLKVIIQTVESPSSGDFDIVIEHLHSPMFPVSFK